MKISNNFRTGSLSTDPVKLLFCWSPSLALAFLYFGPGLLQSSISLRYYLQITRNPLILREQNTDDSERIMY